MAMYINFLFPLTEGIDVISVASKFKSRLEDAMGLDEDLTDVSIESGYRDNCYDCKYMVSLVIDANYADEDNDYNLDIKLYPTAKDDEWMDTGLELLAGYNPKSIKEE